MTTPRKKVSQAASADAKPDGQISFEAAIEEIEAIIERIESGEIGLEDSIEAYERGSALIKRCRTVLERSEQRIIELEAAGSEGGTAGKPAHPGDDPPDAEAGGMDDEAPF